MLPCNEVLAFWNKLAVKLLLVDEHVDDAYHVIFVNLGPKPFDPPVGPVTRQNPRPSVSLRNNPSGEVARASPTSAEGTEQKLYRAKDFAKSQFQPVDQFFLVA